MGAGQRHRGVPTNHSQKTHTRDCVMPAPGFHPRALLTRRHGAAATRLPTRNQRDTLRASGVFEPAGSGRALPELRILHVGPSGLHLSRRARRAGVHSRVWGSCCSQGLSYNHVFTIRADTRARIRRWLTHKTPAGMSSMTVAAVSAVDAASDGVRPASISPRRLRPCAHHQPDGAEL